MNVIPRWWLWENLLCRRTGATPQFNACEIILNLMLNLGYDDFKPS